MDVYVSLDFSFFLLNAVYMSLPIFSVCTCVSVCKVGSLACVYPLWHGPELCGCPGATIVPGLHSPVATDVPQLIPCSSHILPTCLDVWVAKRGALLRVTPLATRCLHVMLQGGGSHCVCSFNPATMNNGTEVAPSEEEIFT